MAEVKWIKITTNIFDDEKIKLIDTMPDRDALLVIWFKLLTMAGKTNDNGFLYIIKEMPTTDEMLATIFNRPLNTVRLALEMFKKFGMIEINEHVNIVNWEKHQNIEGLEKIKEQNRLRQQKRRDKLKEIEYEEKESNVVSRDSNATDKDIDIELDLEKDIDYTSILKIWNLTNLPKLKLLSQKRKEKIKLRTKEVGLDNFLKSIDILNNSKFCLGENKNSWKADLDWLISNDTNIVKVLEGKYNDKKEVINEKKEKKYNSVESDDLFAELERRGI